VVLVDAKAPGVTLHELPALPFIPEVPHAEMTLDGVHVAPGDVLTGDGYTKYLKPFRTIEDIHVFAAVFGWLLAVARRSGWPTATQEKLLAVIVTLRGLAQEDPSSPAVHVALGGVFSIAAALTEEIEPLWPSADEASRGKWQRDRALLSIAGRVRSKRLEAAWRSV
jgi:acyl-CoA dehydrogenase